MPLNHRAKPTALADLIKCTEHSEGDVAAEEAMWRRVFCKKPRRVKTLTDELRVSHNLGVCWTGRTG